MRNQANAARRMRRAGVLMLAMLVAGGAGDLGVDDSLGQSRFTPTGAYAAYLVGRAAAKRGDLDLAAEKLEEAARESAKDGPMRDIATQAFIAAVMAGRTDAAQLAATLPDNPVAQLMLGNQDALAGKWDDAEARFAGLPQQQAITQVLRPLLVAWAQAGAGRTGAALATLQSQIDAGRFRAVMALHGAMIADLGGQIPDAARLYRLAQVEYGGLNLRLGIVLASFNARQGLVTEAQKVIGELAASSGDLAMARLGLEADASNKAVRSATDGLAEAYLAMGATLRQQNSGDTAQIVLRLALQVRPDFTAARLLLADVQEAAKRQESALATLVPVAIADPLSPMVRLRRAALLEQLGRTEESQAILETLAREFPDRPEPLAQAGDALRRKGRFTDALDFYNQAIARLGTPRSGNWVLFYDRAVAYERAGDWPKAESDFEYALRLAPDQPAVLNYLAYAWTERNLNLGRARQMLQRAVEQRPQDAAIIDSFGWVLLKQGDGPGALKQLERAVELAPEDAVINGHLGDALAAVGRWREAEFQWRRALNLKPDAPEEKRIVDKLATLPGIQPTQAAAPAPQIR